MAGFTKPKVYTGVAAAISVSDSNGVMQKVAYATGFTLDLSANSEDFNVLGQKYQESIPTYNTWSASSDAKASFENKGQAALLNAYDNSDFVLCEFIINDGKKTDGTVNENSIVKATGYATIESLSIDIGDGVTGISISLKGTGRLGFQKPSYIAVTKVELNKTELALTKDSSEQLVATISPDDATDNGVTWTSSDTSKVTVDEIGFVLAKGITDEPVIITATSDSDSSKTATCSVTVTA